MTTINIGNITISSVWLAVILALLLTSFIQWGITKRKLDDWYWNSFFYYFLIWKLSYILFNFRLFLDMPLSIVYFNGGNLGHFLGLAAITIYLLMLAKRRFSLLFTTSAQIMYLYFTSYQAIISALHGNFIELLLHVGVLGGLILLFRHHEKRELSLTPHIFILLLLLKIFIISIFDSTLSVESLSLTWMGITVLLLTIEKRSEIFG